MISSPRRVLVTVLSVVSLVLTAGAFVPSAARSQGENQAPLALGSPAPDNYTPKLGLLFNHPFWANRGQIATHVKRMIRSTQPRQNIRIASFSVGSKSIVDALIGARNRGVSVQVIGDAHLVDRKNDLYSKGFVRLRRTLGRDKTKTSWVNVCNNSCRGNAGNLHAKIFLFSQVGAVSNIVVTGSANLTRMAVVGQWNHARTVSDPVAYNNLMNVFAQMAADQPVSPPNLEYNDALGHSWVFPWPAMNAVSDPVMTSLSNVQCIYTDAAGATKRTKIRVNMYTWSDERGIWLATRVRQLWDSGCDVAVLNSIMSRNVRDRLGLRSGRGPIPLKKVGVWNDLGELVKYDHAKWLTISGATTTNPNASIVVAGSCNFSNLGRYSDEITTAYSSAADVAAYAADFAATWRERYQTHLPPPDVRSRLGDDTVEFGKGELKYAEND